MKVIVINEKVECDKNSLLEQFIIKKDIHIIIISYPLIYTWRENSLARSLVPIQQSIQHTTVGTFPDSDTDQFSFGELRVQVCVVLFIYDILTYNIVVKEKTSKHEEGGLKDFQS